MAENTKFASIPTQLSEDQFNEFVLPHLTDGCRGPDRKLSNFKIFNYILKFLYTGCQWQELSIDKDKNGKDEIHYTRIHRIFSTWVEDGSFARVFEEFVMQLYINNKSDTSVIHGDGTTTAAKKGGDNIGYNGHKHIKGDKVVAFCDRNCNVLSPFESAAGNRNESPIFRKAMKELKAIFKKVGLNLFSSIMSLDGAYDCKQNRKMIFNSGMTPNINSNKRNTKKSKRGRKPIFDPAIFAERFNTIERVFGWEDKFKRLLMRFERISQLHYGLKTLAYTMINLRHFT